MAVTKTFFLNDAWLSEEISTESTDIEQNYYALADTDTLVVALADFSACLNASVVTDPVVEFDGWEVVTIPTAEAQQWQNIMYHSNIGYFATVGDAGAGAIGNAMTSPDGKVWTLLTTPTNNFWFKPIYIPSKDLIVVPTVSGGGTNFLTSDDHGVTWVEGDTGLGDPSLATIVWEESKSLYLATTFDSRIITSPDLVTTWSEATNSPGFFDDPTDIAYAPFLDLFCAVSFYGDVYTSSDGLSWTAEKLHISPSWDSAFIKTTWSEPLKLFVAQGEHHSNWNNPHMFITSPDGVNWTQRPLEPGIVLEQFWEGDPPTFLPAITVYWDDFTNLFYALTQGDDGGGSGSLVLPSMYLLTSPDGIIWTIDTTVPNTHDLPYPLFGNKAYTDLAIKDANNMVMINKATIVRRVP